MTAARALAQAMVRSSTHFIYKPVGRNPRLQRSRDQGKSAQLSHVFCLLVIRALLAVEISRG